MRKSLKVFHGLVNYGTQAGLIAKSLREHGIDAISVVIYDKFNRQIDVELRHGGNIFQKIVRHTRNYFDKFHWFWKYDVFHFYFGTTLLPSQIDLPMYRFFGKKVIMEYLGNDVVRYRKALDLFGEQTHVKKYIENGEEHDKKIDKRYNFERKYIDVQLVCDPSLLLFTEGARLLPLAIDLENHKYLPLKDNNSEITIMHAPTHRGFKGTDYVLSAVNRLKKEGYSFNFDLVENVDHAALKKKYESCDLFIDQLNSGWYGTASIEAMAIGRPVVCFLRESYLECVPYREKIPIINADRYTVYEVVKDLLNNKEKLLAYGKRSRKFVEEVHSLKQITQDVIKIYEEVVG